MKLRLTERNCNAAVIVLVVLGLGFILLVRDARLAMVVFLVGTAVEAFIFTTMYFLRSRWRDNPMSRAIFWIVLAYFCLSFHISISYFWRTDYALREPIRQFAYLFLMATGLNLTLTLLRMQQDKEEAIAVEEAKLNRLLNESE